MGVLPCRELTYAIVFVGLGPSIVVNQSPRVSKAYHYGLSIQARGQGLRRIGIECIQILLENTSIRWILVRDKRESMSPLPMWRSFVCHLHSITVGRWKRGWDNADLSLGGQHWFTSTNMEFRIDLMVNIVSQYRINGYWVHAFNCHCLFSYELEIIFIEGVRSGPINSKYCCILSIPPFCMWMKIMYGWGPSIPSSMDIVLWH